MPPVQVHSDSPLRPQAEKASAPNPQTALPQDQPAIAHNNEGFPAPTRTVPATATGTAQAYPPSPQPGARPTPTQYIPPQSDGPPPPQPGEAPVPAPGVTATHVTTLTSQYAPQGPPQQFGIPAPNASLLGTKSTSSVPPPPKVGQSGTAAFPAFQDGAAPAQPQQSPYEAGGAPLNHPPGYVQNPYADGTALDRERRNSLVAEESVGEAGVWGNVKKAMGDVGEKLVHAEEQAWKWANGK